MSAQDLVSQEVTLYNNITTTLSDMGFRRIGATTFEGRCSNHHAKTAATVISKLRPHGLIKDMKVYLAPRLIAPPQNHEPLVLHFLRAYGLQEGSFFRQSQEESEPALDEPSD